MVVVPEILIEFPKPSSNFESMLVSYKSLLTHCFYLGVVGGNSETLSAINYYCGASLAAWNDFFLLLLLSVVVFVLLVVVRMIRWITRHSTMFSPLMCRFMSDPIRAHLTNPLTVSEYT